MLAERYRFSRATVSNCCESIRVCEWLPVRFRIGRSSSTARSSHSTEAGARRFNCSSGTKAKWTTPPMRVYASPSSTCSIITGAICARYRWRSVSGSWLRSFVPVVALIYSKHIIGKGKALFEAARRRNLEGLVGKRRDSAYLERRTRDWVKIKSGYEQELVVGGWTEGRGSRVGFGALLVGYYEGGHLRYAGSVGTGFDHETLLRFRRKLDGLKTARCPFTPAPPIAGARWVRPRLVVQVRFEEWTDAGLMRQPAFLGMRDDKAARDVVCVSAPRADSRRRRIALRRSRSHLARERSAHSKGRT